jgi:L-rhamnose mutarotase
MQRIGFRLQLKIELIDEYVKHHERVWPEMLHALAESGWHNYSLFLDRTDGSLFGYFETENLAKAKAAMAETDVNARWQEMMGPFFEDLEGTSPDEGFKELQQVFYLP